MRIWSKATTESVVEAARIPNSFQQVSRLDVELSPKLHYHLTSDSY